MVARLILAAGMALMLAGCQTVTGGKGGAFCDVARPLRPSSQVLQKMTEAEINDMLSHNRYGQKACGWRQ